jgi:hypothetical protein
LKRLPTLNFNRSQSEHPPRLNGPWDDPHPVLLSEPTISLSTGGFDMSSGLDGRSPTDVTHHLKGIDFPAGKQDLLKHAKQQGADGTILELIGKMPDDRYETMADVMKGVGKSE